MRKNTKKAQRKCAVDNLKKLIDEKFAKCNFDDRQTLFVELEKWGKESLSEEACDMFLEALYNAKSTQDIQFDIAVEKAFESMGLGGK